MTQEDKELLLKDLCARLPYKVYAQIPDEYGGYTSAIESVGITIAKIMLKTKKNFLNLSISYAPLNSY